MNELEDAPIARSLVTPPPAALTYTTDWRVVVDAYLGAAIDSPHTRRAYDRHLTDAFTALDVQTVAELNGAQLAAYRAAVVGAGRAPASQGQALAALRSFLTWSRTLGAHQLPAEVIAAALRTPRSSVKQPYSILSEPEVGAILAAAATARDRALLGVLLGAGLRAAEATGLDIADVRQDQDGETILHVHGKGRQDRTVPIQPDLARLIRTYLAATGRRLGDAGPLFRGHDRAAAKLPRGRLTTRAAGYLVARCAAAAGIDAKRISPHSLRHTFAIRSLRAKHDVIAVQKLLGHASVATTLRHLDHPGLAELRQAVPLLPVG